MAHPADVLKLETDKWKLDTPIWKEHVSHDSKHPKNKARAVEGDALRTFEDKGTDTSCFFVNGDGKSVVMRVHHGGPTTKSSWNPRCELQDKTTDTWPGGDGRTHTLTVVGQITRLTPVTKTVVLAQVHGKDDDVTVFRLEDETLYVTWGDKLKHPVAKDVKLGTQYTLKIEVKDGETSWWYQGEPIHVPFPTTRNTDPANYFKAGNYLQSNLNPDSADYAPHESTDNYSEVVLYSVTATHSGGHH